MMYKTLLHFSVASGSSDTPISSLSPIWRSIEVARKISGNVCDKKPSLCLQHALADTHYYLLGFYLRSESKPGWHTLQVKVNQPNVTVLAREGFAADDGAIPPRVEKIEKNTLATASANDDAVRVALSSPLDYTSVPLRLQWSVVSTQGLAPQVELVLTSPPGGIAVDPGDSSLNVDFLAFIKLKGATEGQPFPASLVSVLNTDQQKNLATAGFRFRKTVSLAPGRYEVRVFLRDNIARKTGTVSTQIELTSPRTPASGAQKPDLD